MNSNIGDLIAQYRDKGIWIDTNLFLVGNIDRRLVGRIGKTDKYTRQDYERITDVLGYFNRCIIVPAKEEGTVRSLILFPRQLTRLLPT